MSANRIGTLVQQNLALERLRQLQAQFNQTAYQASSGLKAQRYSGYGLDVRRLVSLETQQIQTQRYIDNNNRIDSRLQTMETQTSTLFDIATKFRATLVQALSAGNAQEMNLQTTASGLLNQVAGVLNKKEDGRYLFAGSQTRTAPVDLNDPGFTAPPATYPSSANYSYYQGNDQTLRARADDNLIVDYGIKANEPGFEELIRALELTATNPDLSRDRLQEALSVVGDAIQNIPAVQSKIGSVRATLETTNKRLQDSRSYADQNISDIKNVDVAEATARLQSQQVALQASYATLVQVQKTTLLQYL